MRSSLLIMCFIASLFPVFNPVLAEINIRDVSESVVRVRAYKDNKLIDEGSGFVINEVDNVLTSAHLLEGADRVAVVSLRTTAEIKAVRIFDSSDLKGRDLNLALLHVQGLQLRPLSLYGKGTATGEEIRTPTFIGHTRLDFINGQIATYSDIDGSQVDKVYLLHHDAIVSRTEFGMPVFNKCGQVVAMNQPEPVFGHWPSRSQVAVPKTSVFALRSFSIIPILDEKSVPFVLADKDCPSEAPSIIIQPPPPPLPEPEIWKWAVAGGAVLVLLALLGWLVFARKKKAQVQRRATPQPTRQPEPPTRQSAPPAQQPTPSAPPEQQPAPFSCLLEGQDETGQSFTLNVSAAALGRPDGVVLGRNPANSEFIIDHESVSREHARLTYADGQLYAEDLETTNGSKVNGRPLSPRERVPLSDNDQLEMGPVVFTVRLR